MISKIQCLVRLSSFLSWGAEQQQGLRTLRHATLNMFACMFAIAIGLVAVARVVDGRYLNALIDLVAILLVVIAMLLARQGRWHVAVWISSLTPVVAAFALDYLGLIAGARIIPQLVLSIVTSLLIFERQRYRFVYIVVCLILLTISSMAVDGEWLSTLVFLAQIIAFAIIFLAFIYLFEKQHEDLNETIGRLEHSNAERKAANQALNERVEELVVFSHIMGHDLISPLTAILGYAELLEEETSSMDAEAIESVQGISSAAKSMNTLILDLLTYSKISLAETHVETVDMNRLLAEVEELLVYQVQRDSVTIEVGALHPVDGNPDLFKAVFQNLLANAIKYQPQDIRSHHPFVQVWSEMTEDTVTFRVRDNGIGIEKEYLPKLFKPFQRLQGNEAYEGNGLGMSICLSIVEKYHGTIELEDTGPLGSTFALTFPRFHSPSLQESPIHSSSANSKVH